MGLIRAAKDAVKGTIADQWKEYIYCESLPADVLATKGHKKTKGNNRGDDNIISNGSGVVVNEGQCMIIVENGKIVEICSEAGEFTYDSSSEASIFTGNLSDSVVGTFKSMVDRFSKAGDAGKDQRVYYFNTKEIIDNKFGTANPVPFRVVDSKINLDIDVALRCSGVFSYKIVDPILFYTNVCGNVKGEYNRSEIDTTLKTEFISALQPALAKLSDKELRPNQIIAHNTDLEDAMNDTLSTKWGELRGIKVVSVALGSVTLPDEDAELIKNAQRAAMNMNPGMAMANALDAQNEALKTAAGNAAGAMAGFMGMNMAGNMAGATINTLAGMQQAQPQQAGWTCSCGTVNTGKFCSNCGKQNPALASWTCSCGTVNTGNFCANCGAKRP